MQRAIVSTVCLSLVLCMLLDIVDSVSIPDNHRLYDALHHFDVLHKTHLRHRIRKEHQLLYFTTLNRTFHLVLHPRKTQFHKDLEVHIVEGSGKRRKHGLKFDHFHQGSISGEPDSTVIAHLDPDKGILTASIRAGDEHYFIEPSHRHFTQSHDFHMISYRTSDLRYNLTNLPSEHYCGTKHGHIQMNTAQSKSHEDFSLNKRVRDPSSNNNGDVTAKDESHNILKRQQNAIRDSCPLHIVANFKFHQAYSPSGNMDDSILFMILVIDMVDQDIYRNTQWANGQLGLSIKNVTVYTSASASPIYNSNRQWVSNDLLEEFSHEDWSDVCLAHLFTAETLSDGRLGVAYIASSNPSLTGGICSSALRNFNGAPIVTANVGVSSFLRDSRKLLLAEAKLVTAHEIGHNWGSEHDPTSNDPCNPGLNNGGNFLMFPSATDGTQDNNDEFSMCSIRMINSVLQNKMSQCFIETVENQCGDYEVNSGEECDAGFSGMIGNDPCCTSACTLREGMNCSDINNQCCENCDYASNTTVCRTFNEGDINCLANVNCDGISKDCPSEVLYLPPDTACRGSGMCLPVGTNCSSDGTPCVKSNSSEQTCFDICELHGMKQCFCTSETADECHICCTTTDNNGNKTNCEVFRGTASDPPVNLLDGTTCLGGLCRAGECNAIVQDLVQRLFSLFTDISIDKFFRFVADNIVGAVLFFTVVVWIPIALSIHCCYDRKVWKEFKEKAAEAERERLIFDDEDNRDLFDLVNLVAMVPAINLDQAKKGLQRMSSRKDGQELIRTDSGNYYLPSPTSTIESPTKPLWGERKLSNIVEECDPARDNILTHLSTSQGTNRGSYFESTTLETPFLATDV